MNRQGFDGDGRRGIEWLRPPIKNRPGFTWSPVTGCTNTFCEVRADCWARRMAKRHKNDDFLPRLHEDRLKEPANRKTPAIIATCLMGDMFSTGVPDEWIQRVFWAMDDAPQHVFIILTKCPERLWDFFPMIAARRKHLWVGTSISDQASLYRWLRLQNIDYLLECNLVLSIEPLREPFHFVDYGFELGFNWLFIGGQSGSNPFQPPHHWVTSIINQVRKYSRTPILIKDNAGYPQLVREWPRSILTHLNGGKFNEF